MLEDRLNRHKRCSALRKPNPKNTEKSQGSSWGADSTGYLWVAVMSMMCVLRERGAIPSPGTWVSSRNPTLSKTVCKDLYFSISLSRSWQIYHWEKNKGQVRQSELKEQSSVTTSVMWLDVYYRDWNLYNCGRSWESKKWLPRQSEKPNMSNSEVRQQRESSCNDLWRASR